jgi:hypothetical protein
MTDEEAMFNVWFHIQRRESFDKIRDYGRFEDHPNWGMGAYDDMKKAWMARSTLHVVTAAGKEGGG